MKMSELAIDSARLETGAWVDDIPEMEGLRLRVRGSNNADWRRLQTKLIEAVPRKQRLGGRLDPDTQDRITSSLLLNTCLLDWEGLEGDDGQPVPYDKKMAEKLITDPQYRRFREAVVWAASVVAEQTDIDMKDAEGNLLRLSSGNTSTASKLKAG